MTACCRYPIRIRGVWRSTCARHWWQIIDPRVEDIHK